MDRCTSTLSELAVSALKNVCLLLKISTSACACMGVVTTLVVPSAVRDHACVGYCATLPCLCTVSSLGGVPFAVFCAPLVMVLPPVHKHDELALLNSSACSVIGRETRDGARCFSRSRDGAGCFSRHVMALQ